MVILDQQTNKDSTCLLLSFNELDKDPHNYMQVQVDFESAIVVLKTIEIGLGNANSRLSMEYKGSDGVLRISVRDWMTTLPGSTFISFAKRLKWCFS